MTTPSILSFHSWQTRTSEFRSEVRQWTEPHRKRKSTRSSHPIHDFLFTYYSYPLGRLETWHPGADSLLALPTKGEPRIDPLNEKHYSIAGPHLFLDLNKIPESRAKTMRWISQLLRATEAHTPNYNCYGMHEWAMVYEGIDVRHKESLPFRLSQTEIDAFVRSRPMCCSHHDAFRFFVPSSQAFNRLQPAGEDRIHNEQPACIHTNMDVYKWAYKCMPWISSDLLWRCFLNALEIRELDMRAAPYDLSLYNLTPIKVEQKEGRAQYEELQRKLAAQTQPLRTELITAIDSILHRLPNQHSQEVPTLS